MDIKTVKGKDYLQIVDNRGYIHHVGPANLLNFAVCQRILGFDNVKEQKRFESFENYFALKGYPRWEKNEWGPAKKMASEVVIHYVDAWSGLCARTNICGDAEVINQKEDELNDRIEIVGMLEELMREDVRKENITHSEEVFRKKVQLIYRYASPEQKALWKKELERKRELEDERISQILEERFKARAVEQ
jgi:hypothetical protein